MRKADIRQSSEASQGTNALGRLALALASGKDAMRRFRGSPSENHAEKHKLNAPIAGMECYMDRIVSYISCYSSVINAEQASALFTRLIDELQAAFAVRQVERNQKEAWAFFDPKLRLRGS
jgi:hypothetical protein